jgi:hypothetical protein
MLNLTDLTITELKEVEEAIFNNNGTGTTSNGEDDVRGVEEGDVNVNVNNNTKSAKLAKSDKLDKLVEQAKSAGGQGQAEAEEGVPGEPPGGRSAGQTSVEANTPRSAS